VTTHKPLLEMTAADLMSRDLITIPRQMTLHGAAHRLSQSHVSGAPVIDDDGRCVGVLSATDLVRWLDVGRPQPGRSGCQEGEYHSPWQMPEGGPLPDDEVSCHMTTDVVTAPEKMGIGELARLMVDAQIHRVIILDAKGRPAGLVTGTDILAAVADYDRQERERILYKDNDALA